MFNVISEQFAALQKSNLEQFTKATELAFFQAERAMAFNVGVAKQVAGESLSNAKSFSSVKDVQGVAALFQGAEGKAEQLATFGKAAYDHATRVQAESAKFSEAAAAEINASFVKFIDNVAKASPVGGEAFSAQFKQVVAAQQAAAAQATQAFKQATSAAESQWKQATSVAQNAVVATVAKGKARK